MPVLKGGFAAKDGKATIVESHIIPCCTYGIDLVDIATFVIMVAW